MEYANPEWFWALLIIPVILGVYIYRFVSRKRSAIAFSSVEVFEGMSGNWKAHIHWITFLFSLSAMVLLIVALARPQNKLTTIERNAEGIDIVMVLDMSSSMKAEDLKPNRFEASREVAKQFVDKRLSDRIGLVTFAMKSFTVCPPTLDYRLLKQLIDEVQMGIIEDGTAIGMGIATAINRLKDSEAKSKVIIILTDGDNNAGEIDPVTAADLALTYGIKIYTIGAGTRGTAPFPVQDPIFGPRYRNIQVNIDEDMLTRVAELTGGKYYRATNTEQLGMIYDEIDLLEKSKVEEVIYTDYEDRYPFFLAISISLLMVGFIIDKVWLRSIAER